MWDSNLLSESTSALMQTRNALEKHYCFCEVHFKRSLTRVRRNGAIVSSEKEMDFYRKTLELLDPDLSNNSFQTVVKELKSEYPKCKKWLDWYLHPETAKLIFPAMSSNAVESICKDTNAQESLGGDFQKTAPRAKSSIQEALDHSFRYVQSIEMDFERAVRGMPLRYQAP